ncbi:MAG: co-chaperone GroES [bacterium]
MKLRPLGERLVVKRRELEEKTGGGIIIPDSAKEKPMQAEVVAVGPEVNKDREEVKEGDMILFSKFSGNDVTVGGEEHLILRKEDVLAIIEQ